MNCEDLIGGLGFRCKALDRGALRLWSPFTYGNDGQVVALYIEPAPSGYRITDNAQSFMHASATGAKLSPSRLAVIQRCAGRNVIVSDGGEIYAVAALDQLREAVIDVLNAALAVSHYGASWIPKPASTVFSDAVGQVLEDTVGERLKRNVVVTGASGHQIEIPFVVESNGFRTYIQPVAYGDQKVEWDYVYRGLGKMIDLKNAGAEDEARAIVIEDAVADDEIAKAATLLSVSAAVVYFSKMRVWANRRFLLSGQGR